MIAAEGLEVLAVLPMRDHGQVIAALIGSSHCYCGIEDSSRVALECLVAQAEGAIGSIRQREERQIATRRLQLAVEGADLGTWMADFESGAFEASMRARELHGVAAQESLTIESAVSCIHPGDRAKVAALLQQSFMNGAPFSSEYRISDAQGGVRWIASDARIFDGNGDKFLYGISRDITPRKMAETSLIESRDQLETRVAERTAALEAANAALREESKRLELALECSRAGTWLWDVWSEVIECDNRERALYGFEDDVVFTFLQCMERIHPDDRHVLVDRLKKATMARGPESWTTEFRIVHPQHGERWLGGLGSTERDASGNAMRMVGINFDITERKLVEQTMKEWNQTLERRVAERTAELNQSEERFRQLAEATFEGIAVTENGILIDGNPQLAEIHGYELPEMIGRLVLDFIAPESRALVAKHKREQNGDPYECYGLRKDGSTFPTEVHACMRTWYGKQTRVTAVRNLTDIKQAAARLQAQQTELDHAQRLALVSEVSAGIIHQVGQPLCGMGANLAAALINVGSCKLQNCGALEIIKDVDSDVARLREIVVHMRALANPARADRARFDFNALVSDVLRLMRPEAGRSSMKISTDFGPDIPDLDGDSVQLSQVVLNLVRNAFDACAARPLELRHIGIATRRIDGGRHLELCVSDSGTGIAPEVMEGLFAPFFTTKPEGLGMGLRLSQTIVQAHCGSIKGFNNSDGVGATFRVLLPAGS